ncbi:hypothetical protein Ssi02_51250 [Sinosporangium siamense]|uniref:Uncharacterized protein n=1 Tax=Sinosporangium siamense TaxID=1367973 RepID=A0A919VE93_9ACTN|nr:hypothetical protein Ssi02_51250 [Sinosporangium siamense]
MQRSGYRTASGSTRKRPTERRLHELDKTLWKHIRVRALGEPSSLLDDVELEAHRKLGAVLTDDVLIKEIMENVHALVTASDEF